MRSFLPFGDIKTILRWNESKRPYTTYDGEKEWLARIAQSARARTP